MAPAPTIMRGAPRYVRGAAAGPWGVLSLVPEVAVSADGQHAWPHAVVVITPAGVRRYVLDRSRPAAAFTAPVTAPSAATYARDVVVGASEAPAEDPRVAAVFGPLTALAEGARLPLARQDGSGPDARCTALGEIAIRAGAIRVALAQGPRSPLRPVLGVAFLLAAGAAIRRLRRC